MYCPIPYSPIALLSYCPLPYTTATATATAHRTIALPQRCHYCPSRIANRKLRSAVTDALLRRENLQSAATVAHSAQRTVRRNRRGRAQCTAHSVQNIHAQYIEVDARSQLCRHVPAIDMCCLCIVSAVGKQCLFCTGHRAVHCAIAQCTVKTLPYCKNTTVLFLHFYLALLFCTAILHFYLALLFLPRSLEGPPGDKQSARFSKQCHRQVREHHTLLSRRAAGNPAHTGTGPADPWNRRQVRECPAMV